MVPFSILDLAPVAEGSTPANAFQNSLAMARHAESLGYKRFWLAEHHNNPGIASAATAVVIAHVAAGTQTIRVGSGGVMLPNHAPLVIAEQFGTLASLYPDRIDLGLGRAPGTDMFTARALRRDLATNADQFPTDVQELQFYFEPVQPGQKIRAIPGAGLQVPIWLLGSSLYSAQVAAMLGLPFAFASHFAPELMMQAIQIYRERFKPSSKLDKPYVMLCANVIAADSEREAKRLFTSLQQAVVMLQRGTPGKWPAPIDDIETFWSPAEKAGADRFLTYAFIGTTDTIQAGIGEFIEATGMDELMITTHVYEQEARLRSLEIAAHVRDRLSLAVSK
ncbi:MAG: LLM class flavin-dependent oxidoreductase [Spirochaetia bacterium]|nr:LLM class flavin-dependent oxidoreductase [Spirochaetia bacterium]